MIHRNSSGIHTEAILEISSLLAHFVLKLHLSLHRVHAGIHLLHFLEDQISRVADVVDPILCLIRSILELLHQGIFLFGLHNGTSLLLGFLFFSDKIHRRGDKVVELEICRLQWFLLYQ